MSCKVVFPKSFLGLLLKYCLLLIVFSINIKAADVELTWGASESAGVVSYRIYIYDTAKKSEYSQFSTGMTSHIVTGLSGGSTYRFSVTSLDGFGQESIRSTSASIFIPGGQNGGGTSNPGNNTPVNNNELLNPFRNYNYKSLISGSSKLRRVSSTGADTTQQTNLILNNTRCLDISVFKFLKIKFSAKNNSSNTVENNLSILDANNQVIESKKFSLKKRSRKSFQINSSSRVKNEARLACLFTTDIAMEVKFDVSSSGSDSFPLMFGQYSTNSQFVDIDSLSASRYGLPTKNYGHYQNIIQAINYSSGFAGGTLLVYNIDGSELFRSDLNLAPGASGTIQIPSGVIGQAHWIPSSTANVELRNIVNIKVDRKNLVALRSAHNFVTNQQALALNSNSVIHLVNTSSNADIFRVYFYDRAGTLVAFQDVEVPARNVRMIENLNVKGSLLAVSLSQQNDLALYQTTFKQDKRGKLQGVKVSKSA